MNNRVLRACPRCHHQRCVCTTIPISRHMLGDILNDYLRLVGNDSDRKVRIRGAQRALQHITIGDYVR